MLNQRTTAVRTYPRLIPALFIFLVVSAAYLYTFPQANVLYAGVVLLHALAGAIVALLLAIYLFRIFRDATPLGRAGWLLLLSGAIVGILLVKIGTPRAEWKWLYAHILISLAGAGILFSEWLGRRESHPVAASLARAGVALLVLTALGFGAHYLRQSRWQNHSRIENPKMPPAEMADEGDGSNGAFFPSSAQVLGGQKIPSEYFMESDSCQRCHQDIYQQWFSSMHHFSSFNNQWYRKSIEYMQDTIGTKPSKWCGGCHDPAVLYSGKMDTPIRQIVHTPAAQAGLGCMMCHSIARVKSTMGQADFYLEYPRLHQLAASKNPIVRSLHDFLVKLNPEPHRRVFLKPFMRDQTAEFCSSCHKVHLDVPVNSYRWLRGFNEYDNWQASGVSGQGARSFYYPEKSSTCSDCHMPLVASHDPGNKHGQIHSHRFPAANSAVPYVNHDAEQLKVTEDFLKSGFITVDLFAAAPVEAAKGELEMRRRATNVTGDAPALASTFAVSEESEQSGPVVLREVGKIAAPIDAPGVRFQPGKTIRVDAVVRTRKIGHFFPGGTVDGYDVWLEFKAVDAGGRVLAWSGQVAENGRGPVEPGAHFYRSYQLDGEGRPINKRNAWQTRSVLYVRLIPPGAADTVHFQLPIPANARGPIKLETKLNYRKFARYYTQFAFAGVAKPGPATVDSDGREYTFDSAPVPDLPIVTIASAHSQIELGEPNWTPQVRKQDRERWNDWGIGLLLQGDLKAAEYAFHRVTEAEPGYADGWLNIG